MVRWRFWMLVVSAAVCSISSARAQDTLNFPVLGEVIRQEAAVDKLLPKDAKIEVLCSGFEWSEGPFWIPGKDKEPGYLLFSDIPRNSIMKWVEGKGVSLWLKPAGYTGVGDYSGEPGSNGLILDPKGQLVCCEHGDRRVSVVTTGGGKRTLVDNYEGKRLNSPNDATFHSNGDLYFTDPPYGLPKQADDPSREMDYCGVFRVAKDGKVTLLTKEMTRPNGIAFSPDEKTLYVAQSDPEAAVIKSFPVKADGTLGDSKLVYDFTADFKKGLPGLPDGLAVDEHGNLWATAPGGVSILTPDGKRIGRLSTGQNTANCKFGGADGKTLFLCADMYVCRVKTLTKAAR